MSPNEEYQALAPINAHSPRDCGALKSLARVRRARDPAGVNRAVEACASLSPSIFPLNRRGDGAEFFCPENVDEEIAMLLIFTPEMFGARGTAETDGPAFAAMAAVLVVLGARGVRRAP
ncbi:MAG: hypothetical protein LC750_00435 [Actinobacteria bacterium]|nr:hypothetical protein [Actinomycetota bacterium]